MSISRLEAAISRRFPALCVSPVTSSFVLDIWRMKADNHGLTWLPNFHLIVFQDINGGGFRAKLATFHGKTVDSVRFSLSDGDVLPGNVDEILAEMSAGLRLCRGFSPAESNKENVLHEYLNDEVVSRSTRCHFKLSPEEKSELCQECEEELKNGDGFKPENNSWIDLASEANFIGTKEEPGELDVDPILFLQQEDLYVDQEDCQQYSEHEEDVVLNDQPRKKRKTGKTRRRRAKENFRKTCKICLHEYQVESYFEEDQAKHAKFFDLETPATCPLCRKEVPKIELTDHFAQFHSPEGEPTTCCAGCLRVMPNEPDILKSHIASFHHARCVCEKCGKNFNSVRYLDAHMMTAHSKVRDHCCDRCGKGFGHKYLLDKHIRDTCTMEEWHCPVCSNMYTSMGKLRAHFVVHCDLKPYVCRYCTYSSNKCTNVCLHVKKVHKLKGFKEDVKVLEDLAKEQKDYIWKLFSQVTNFKAKRKSRGDLTKSHSYKNQKPKRCHLCGETFASGDILGRHFDVHSARKPFKCRLCDFASHKESLVAKQHFNSVHSEMSAEKVNACVVVDPGELEEMKKFTSAQLKLCARANSDTM